MKTKRIVFALRAQKECTEVSDPNFEDVLSRIEPNL